MADLTDCVSQQPIAILHGAIMQIDGVARAILIPLLTDEDTVVVQGMQLERVRTHRSEGNNRGATGSAGGGVEEDEEDERQVETTFHGDLQLGESFRL